MLMIMCSINDHSQREKPFFSNSHIPTSLGKDASGAHDRRGCTTELLQVKKCSVQEDSILTSALLSYFFR